MLSVAKIVKVPTWVEEQEQLFQIGLTLIPGIGAITAKKLLAHFGSPEAIFREKRRVLAAIPRVGQQLVDALRGPAILLRADEELQLMQRHGIKAHWYLSDSYPYRLKQCADSPILLFTKGNVNLDVPRLVSIVGTRHSTAYGQQQCERIVAELAEQHIPVVSGLAYGIDICAHRAAVQQQLPTIGVMAHGLDRVYPWQHRHTVEQMLEQGGLVSEFLCGTMPDRENFPKRNRIVAGLTDAVIVIESKKRGGSLITAEIANSYSRDVFALPGRIGDETSEGCNYLIRINKAHLLESVDNLRYIMGWQQTQPKAAAQASLFDQLSPHELKVVDALREMDEASADGLAAHTKLSNGVVAATLLNLEFSGTIRSLPGKRYQLA